MEGVSHQTVAHGVQAGQPRLTHTFAADRESPFMKPDTGKLYVRFVRRTEASSSLGASSDPTAILVGWMVFGVKVTAPALQATTVTTPEDTGTAQAAIREGDDRASI